MDSQREEGTPLEGINVLFGTFTIVDALLSFLSASDVASLLAAAGFDQKDFARYLTIIRDLPDPEWWKWRISQGFEIYLIGPDVTAWKQRIDNPEEYWKKNGKRVLRIWAAVICPEAERRRRTSDEVYVVRNYCDWSMEWFEDFMETDLPLGNYLPYKPCYRRYCLHKIDPPPICSYLLPLPFHNPGCYNKLDDWVCGSKDPGLNGIELVWACTLNESFPTVEVCPNPARCGCSFKLPGIDGIDYSKWDWCQSPSVPYIDLSVGKIASSVWDENTIYDPNVNIAVEIRLCCEERGSLTLGYMRIGKNVH